MKKIKIYILTILIWFCSHTSFGQVNVWTNKKNYYCTNWLFELPDTMQLFEKFESLPKEKMYSHIHQIKGTNYRVLGWSGKHEGIEDPVEVSDKIEILFNNNIVSIKVGGIDYLYIYKPSKNKTFLIRKK